MFRAWAIRAVAVILLAGAGGIGSSVAAPIPAGQRTYVVEASAGPGRSWVQVGSYSSQTDALRAANRYKLKGYAVRMRELSGSRNVPVPGYAVDPVRRHATGR